MTQLRHDRPALRYSDNIRRELQRSTLPAAASPAKVTKATPRRLQRPRDDRAYDRHMAAFDQLPEEARTALDQLFARAGQMMESQLAYVESIGTRKRSDERSAAYEADKQALRSACCIYNAHCRDEVRDGRSVTREWFARLRVIMGTDWAHFIELDELLAETRNA